jgi:alpha-galactosidase
VWSDGPIRLVLRCPDREPAAATVSGPGSVDLGGVACRLDFSGNRWSWAVTATDEPRLVDALAFEFELDPAAPVGPVHVFAHGYQSWAPTRTRRLGIDVDPSRDERTHPLVRAAYHADPGVAAPGELRSEQVTVIDRAGHARLCIGFDGGERHAGTLRLRLSERGAVVVRAEAWLGGATLSPGIPFALHDVVAEEGDDPDALLEAWASLVGRRAGARVDAAYRAGWCSWYHYFHDVDERALHLNLTRASTWPFTVFQLDDGYQADIGDWCTTNDKFPSGVDGVAGAIAAAGMVPGLWLAPLLASPTSAIARSHPEWLARAPRDDRPAIGMTHDVWGGVMWQLDVTHPDVLLHLERTSAALVEAGYQYLKLDFTFSAAMPGRFHDPTMTPAQRVRAGYDAIRRGAGNDVFILGCGAPLGALVGVVDGMRIGADVAPWWNAPADQLALPGYEAAAPATRHAFVNTCTRAFQHRRLWLNDPDCVMLRTTETRLEPDAAQGWAATVGASGGMVLVSDDLALLGPAEHALLDDVLAAGAEADRRAAAGAGPRALGTLDPAGPFGFATLPIDPETGAISPSPAQA